MDHKITKKYLFYCILSCILFPFLTSAAKLENNLTNKSPLAQAKILAKNNNCSKVIQLLEKRQVLQKLESETEFVEYYHFLGSCYFKEGQVQKAKKELNELLFINPNFELEPFITPPSLLNFFADLKKDVEKKSKELFDAKEKALDSQKLEKEQIIYYRTSPFLAFMPFGIGQFENRHQTKGIIVASLQGAFLVSNIGFYWWKYALAEQGNPKNAQLHSVVQTMQYVAIGAFVSVYVYSVVDAVLNRKSLSKRDDKPTSNQFVTNFFIEEFKQARKQTKQPQGQT